MTNKPYKYICAGNVKKIIVYDNFSKYIDEIKEIMTDNKIEEIDNCSYLNESNCLNFENNSIKKITYKDAMHENDGVHNINLKKLPTGLEVLNLSYSYLFFSKLDNLPDGLKKLLLPSTYIYELDNLPINIEYLLIYSHYIFKQNLSYLSEGLKELIVITVYDSTTISLDNLPCGLEKLEIDGMLSEEISLENLPRKLKVLHLPEWFITTKYVYNCCDKLFNKPIHNLSPNLQELKVSYGYTFLQHTLKFNISIQLEHIVTNFTSSD